MNQEIKTRWLDALRSGEYQQGLQKLRGEDDTFCCLGVLCDLYAKETGTEWSVQNGWMEFLGHETYLPDRVAVWADCDTYPRVPFSGESLAGMNDTGTTFAQIADLIEEYL